MNTEELREHQIKRLNKYRRSFRDIFGREITEYYTQAPKLFVFDTFQSRLCLGFFLMFQEDMLLMSEPDLGVTEYICHQEWEGDSLPPTGNGGGGAIPYIPVNPPVRK